MPAKAFFDTNVLIYAVTDGEQGERVDGLLKSGGIISVQVLNEFASVGRRKLKMTWAEVTKALDAIRVLCPDPRPLTLETHDKAFAIARHYRYEIYDSLIIASALEAKCAILYSEDMQHDQRIEGSLTVRNPFKD
jgi:predicted nucleic acid-binding protein